jgi:prepilin signal peptidase PulO-like enzyme (type II secretory pathway)
MRVDVPTLLYVVYIALFMVLFVVAGVMFGFRWVTFAFMAFTVIVIVMIDFTSRLIHEPEAK